MLLLIHIVPQLSTVTCGVTDYAILVGKKIEELQPGVRCAYIACSHRAADGPRDVASGQRDIRGTCDARFLWQAVQDLIDELDEESAHEVAIICQYSGYGFNRHGAPQWLADALEKKPSWFATGRVVSIFHELYATGWPWQRAFWQSSQQQAVAIRIARASDALMTNRAASARWLERVTGRLKGSIPSLPVPSNVGEPEEVLRWDSRPPFAILFGGTRFKRPFLEGNSAIMTFELCKSLNIGTIYEIGQRSDIGEWTFQHRGVKIIQKGILPAAQVSEYLLAARMAFVDYFSGYYGKSGIVAAAAAHGTPPIFPVTGVASDGLRFDEHLWDLKSARSISRDDAKVRLTQMSQSIRRWYDQHDSRRHAQMLAELICPDGVVTR